MPNPAARRARRIDRRHRRSSPCAGRFCRRRCAISRAARGPRAGPAQAAAAPLALARRAFWIPFVPAQAGAQDSRLRGNERDYALASNNTSSFPRRVFAPGVCTFASLTRNRGVGGAPRDVRVPAGTRGACHLASKTRVNALMTRHTRRLRGALRPMTRQYVGRNNVTIPMPDGRSVPIVSQTEIEPMKTALSLMLALITTTALTEPLPVPKPPGGRAARARTAISRAAHSARRRRARRRRLPRSGSIVVDLVEPGWQPLAWPANVVQQQVFRDTVPWVVIRVCS